MSAENTLAQETIPLLDRRILLKGLLQTGLAGSVGLGALTSCDATQQSSPVTLHWLTNSAKWGSFDDLATYFNQINQAGITVKPTAGTEHDTVVELFQKQDRSYDLVSLDVTWMREFIKNKWLKPLDDYWPPDSNQLKRTDYLQKPLNICTYGGQLWAAPLHTDVGILYYRLESSNEFSDGWTWNDLAYRAGQDQESHRYNAGFLWEGFRGGTIQQEGLMCTFLEILDGFGGQLFDSADNPQNVSIRSDGAISALEHMQNWNTTISAYTKVDGQQKKASDDADDDCATAWEQGHAAFMRNWPHYITDSDDANNAVAEKYDIAPLPQRVLTSPNLQNTGPHTRSCLGGWQLGINTYSPNQDAAWQFIKWMLGPEAQRYLAYNESFTVTLKSVYNDPYINARNPHYAPLLDIINNAQYRPLLPNYVKYVATPVQDTVSRVLTNNYAPRQAVIDLEQILNNALHKS